MSNLLIVYKNSGIKKTSGPLFQAGAENDFLNRFLNLPGTIQPATELRPFAEMVWRRKIGLDVVKLLFGNSAIRV